MAKLHERTNQTARANQPHTAKRGNKSTTPASSPKQARITPERYPRMSRSAVAFARQMHANPHVKAVMRDLADK